MRVGKDFINGKSEPEAEVQRQKIPSLPAMWEAACVYAQIPAL
jgi:hypothetical protein